MATSGRKPRPRNSGTRDSAWTTPSEVHPTQRGGCRGGRPGTHPGASLRSEMRAAGARLGIWGALPRSGMGVTQRHPRAGDGSPHLRCSPRPDPTLPHRHLPRWAQRTCQNRDQSRSSSYRQEDRGPPGPKPRLSKSALGTKASLGGQRCQQLWLQLGGDRPVTSPREGAWGRGAGQGLPESAPQGPETAGASATGRGAQTMASCVTLTRSFPLQLCL